MRPRGAVRSEPRFPIARGAGAVGKKRASGPGNCAEVSRCESEREVGTCGFSGGERYFEFEIRQVQRFGKWKYCFKVFFFVI